MSLNFDVIPAIDLMGGEVVRLLRGDPSQKTLYGKTPMEAAREWEQHGARWMHVVDLDGAFTGEYKNFAVARDIIASVTTQVELSGGIRTMAAIEAGLTAGAARIILGTKACQEPEFVGRAIQAFGAEKIAVGLDGRWGSAGAVEATTAGWAEQSGRNLISLAQELQGLGVQTFVVTDISRDGTLTGPNLDAIREVLDATSAAVIASGGVSSLKDLQQLNTLVDAGLVGAIVGKALYEGQIDLDEVFG